MKKVKGSFKIQEEKNKYEEVKVFFFVDLRFPHDSDIFFVFGRLQTNRGTEKTRRRLDKEGFSNCIKYVKNVIINLSIFFRMKSKVESNSKSMGH